MWRGQIILRDDVLPRGPTHIHGGLRRAHKSQTLKSSSDTRTLTDGESLVFEDGLRKFVLRFLTSWMIEYVNGKTFLGCCCAERYTR